MKQKCLAIGIILLFVGTCVIPAIAQNTEKQSTRGTWLYVGGSGPGNYTRIQDAINNASDGDTVFIYDDSSPYYENLIIDKPLTVIGENRNTTIIWGNNQTEDMILLQAENIMITQITLRAENLTRIIRVEGDNARFIGNTFINGLGIGFYNSGKNSIIENNRFFNCVIQITDATNILIRGNTMENYDGCIGIYFTTSCTLENNIITGGGLSIVSLYGVSFKIIHNTIQWNESSYVPSHTGLDLINCYNCIVHGNQLTNCGILLKNRPGGEISNNYVNGKPFVYLHNTQNTIIDDAGQVHAVDCRDVTIRNLSISNVIQGITLYNVRNSLINDNVISHCGECIYGDFHYCTFVNNTFDSCEMGMMCGGSRNSISKNRFINCSIFGVFTSATEEIQNNSFSRCYEGVCLARGLCAYNRIENCTIGIQCSGWSAIRVTSNSIRFCSTGIVAGDYGFKSFGTSEMATDMIVSVPRLFRREISYNNIINTSVGALFMNAIFTHWIGNYWGEPYEKPKIIHGYLKYDPYGGSRIEWINIDWHPAQEPYDIPEVKK
jgi:nitrous oxidase accessory protein NosD